ncbi:MAG: rod shape-determining protein RodA [Dehalococcoidia bacterium]
MTAIGYTFERRISLFRGWDRFDYLLTACAMALVGLGLMLIYSASNGLYEGPVTSFENPVMKQAVFACVGIGVMLIVSQIDYHYLIHYAWVFYGIGILALLAILVLGDSTYGSARWFNVGPIQIQPSEFAKIAVILVLAKYFSEHGGDAKDVRALLFSLAVVVPVAFLVFIEPDLGTAVIFLAIWLGIVIVAGVGRRNLVLLGACGLVLVPFVWTFAVADYQVSRVAILVDAEDEALGEGFNVIQSKIAIGAGQLFGKGFTEGEQTQGRFLQGPNSDYIFSVLAEEFGFVGAMGLFLLFSLLLMRGIRAAQIAGDSAGQLVAVGIVVLILLQAFINIAVNVNIFPVTGLPLPFVSQGGSSLVSLFGSLGLLQSIVIRHRAYRQA